MYKFEVFHDMTKINDTLLLNTGSIICKLLTEKYVVTMEVCNLPTIKWKHNVYHNAKDFPKALIYCIKDNLLSSSEIIERNIVELHLNDDEACEIVNVTNKTPADLLTMCMKMLPE